MIHPVLLAEPTEHGLRAWCPFCARWHFHGQGDGHRVAHCIEEDSALHATGYILVLADDNLAIGRERAKRTRRRGMAPA